MDEDVYSSAIQLFQHDVRHHWFWSLWNLSRFLAHILRSIHFRTGTMKPLIKPDIRYNRIHVLMIILCGSIAWYALWRTLAYDYRPEVRLH
jgi:hypothetical protein